MLKEIILLYTFMIASLCVINCACVPAVRLLQHQLSFVCFRDVNTP